MCESVCVCERVGVCVCVCVCERVCVKECECSAALEHDIDYDTVLSLVFHSFSVKLFLSFLSSSQLSYQVRTTRPSQLPLSKVFLNFSHP